MKCRVIERVDQDDRGLTLVELLVALVVGALALASVTLVSTNVYRVFTTTKTATLSNNDNYNVTAILEDLSQYAQSVSPVSGQKQSSIQLAMNWSNPNPPGFLQPFQKDTNVTLSWNANQLQLSDGNTSAVLYTAPAFNAANLDSLYSFVVPSASVFELVPPPANGNTAQTAYFHVETNSGGNIDISQTVGGEAIQLTPKHPDYLPGQSSPYVVNGQPQKYSALVRDGTGNPLKGVALTLSDNGAGGSFSPNSVTTDQNGKANFVYHTSSTESGTVTITATADAGSGTATLEVGAFAFAGLTATPSQVLAGQNVTVSGQVVFNAGSQSFGVAGQTVSFSDQGAKGAFTPTDVETGADGRFSVTYKAPLSTENVTIAVSASDVGQPQTLSLAVVSPEITGVSFDTSTFAPTITLTGIGFGSRQGSLTQFTDVTRGWEGGGIQPAIKSWSDAQVTFTLSSGQIGNYGGGDAGNYADGQGNFVYRPGDQVYFALQTADGLPLSYSATYPADATMPSLTVNPVQPMVPSASQPLTGQLLFNGSPLANAAVNLSVDQGTFSGGDSGTPVTKGNPPANDYQVTTDSQGNFSVDYNSSSANGTFTITVEAGGVTKQVAVNVVTPDISVAAVQTTAASPVVSVTGRVTLNNQGIAGQTVSFSDHGTGGTFAPSTVTTDADGNFSTSYTPPLPSVEWFGNADQPTIVINGSGFGSSQGDGNVQFSDSSWTGDDGWPWNRGNDGKWENYNVLSWTDSQIVVQPISDSKWKGGGHEYGHDPGRLFKQGDQVTVTVITADVDAIPMSSTVNYDNTISVAITAASDGASASASLTVNLSNSLPAPSSQAEIAGISWQGDAKNPTIVIDGSGFGGRPSWPWDLWWRDFNGSIVIKDTTGPWEMGNWGDPVSDDIRSWTDSQIVLRPGWGYGKGFLGFGSGDYFNQGDKVSVTVNVSGSGITSSGAVNYPSDQDGSKNDNH